MITLEYFNGSKWVKVGEFGTEWAAWCSLGGDDYNYRTLDNIGNVLTDRSRNIEGKGDG